MRATTIVASAFCTAFLAHAAHAAQAATPKLPATVAADLKAIAGECTGVGGKADVSNAVKRADLNADGKEDYVLDVGAINCDGAASIYGDREKGVTVYVDDGAGGARNAFSDSVFGVTIEGTGPAARLWLTVSGAQCGKQPARDFASESFCDRPLAWNAKSQKFDYAPVSSARMIQ